MPTPTGTCRSSGSTVDNSESGSIGRFFAYLLLGVVIVALLGAVGFLLSEINHGRYRLNELNDQLIIERGAFLPVGFVAFKPKTEDLQAAYAPLPIPKGKAVPSHEVFDDRADLDRALFAILAGWSRELLESREEADFQLGLAFVQRAESLPGLSEEQRVELRALRADVAFRNGKRIIASVPDQLNQALGQFEMALELGTRDSLEARRWIRDIQRRLRTYKRALDTTPEPEPGAPGTPTLPLESPSDAPTNPTPQSAPNPDAKPSEGSSDHQLLFQL